MGKVSNILDNFLFLIALLMIHRACAAAGSNARCVTSEREALTKLRQGFTDEANLLASWTGIECCKWVGVGCDNNTGNVIKLDLRNANGSSLGGEIGNSLLNLTHLQYIDFSMNDFSQIPTFLGSLTSLTYLNLSSDVLVGEIPESIGNLSSLQYLDIRSNQLTAQSLSFFSNLSSLKYLDLSTVNLANATDWLHSLNILPSLVELRLSVCQLPHISYIPQLNFSSLSVLLLDSNNFNSTIPSWLFNLTNLQRLDLSANSLRGSIPGQLGNLKLLENLVLSSNNLEGGIPDSFGNLCNLTEIFLDYNKLNGEISNSFLGCVTGSLRSLSLEGNSFRGSLPKHLGKFKQLRSFNAFINSFQGNLPDDLGQLKNLEFLALGDNSITGPIPASIGGLSSLKELYLSDNFLNGSIPESLGQLSNLQYLSLHNNSLSGRVSEFHFSNLKSLKRLQLGKNSLVFDIDPAWTAPFQLEIVDLSNNIVGPQFPEWLRTQMNATLMMISNANISSTIPSWFTEISSGIMWLDLSNNLISGNLPELRNYSAADREDIFRCIFLYNNNFSGYLPNFPADMNMFDISNNFLEGEIPQDIASMMPQLQYLRVSNNLLTGRIPTSICKMRMISILDFSKNQLSGTLLPCWPDFLEVLDLSYNKFSGPIATSLGSLNSLQSLHLESNRLEGKIPESFKNFTYMNVLDLSRNGLNGSIPSWIGESLSSLKVLNVQFNRFDSEIPLKLCGLSSLRILNLANNRLTGKIPSCFSNFSGMIETGIEGSWDYGIDDSPDNGDSGWGTEYAERITANLKGRELQYSSTLRFLFSIDLSENNFVGNIPTGLMNLSQLQSLNLSGNNFDGNIPSNIGKLKSLESLDLSWNELSGLIPPSISDLNFLSYLNLSYNNLSGPIPRGNQLQTLDEKSFLGNAGLCGPPLQSCQRNQQPETTNEESEEEEEHEMVWFYSGLAVGFVAGIVGVCSTLYFKDSWRHKYFLFVEKMYSRIYVMLAVKINQQLSYSQSTRPIVD